MSYSKLTSPAQEGIQVIYESCCQRCYLSRFKLSIAELENLNILRQNARKAFDQDNERHKKLLKELWEKVFSDHEYPIDGKSDKWKELGFQGKDPSTDFRGAGIFGLEQLIYLARQYPSEFIAMKQTAKNYSFAISALNITHMIMCFFQIHKHVHVGVTGNRILPIRLMKSFCRLNNENFETVHELFVAAVIKMHDSWVEMNMSKRLNVMHFQFAIKAAEEFVIGLLDAEPRSLQELKKLAFA